MQINWKRHLSNFNWKRFILIIIVLGVANYFRFQVEWRSYEQAIIDTVILSMLGITFLITILKPDFFHMKTMEPADKWMTRILGAIWVAIFLWMISATWELHYMYQLISD